MSKPKEIAKKILASNQRVEWANIENLARAYLELEKVILITNLFMILQSKLLSIKTLKTLFREY